jgi:uncharacterized protein (DUF58 family)
METSELLKKVRRIEIKTRGLSRQVFAGQYHSAFKGRGVAFSEVREYQFGDDIRTIDWNVTARFNHPYVKVFEEERELTVILLVDVSGSGAFGSTGQLKRELITEIAAVIAFSAIQNNDKIGLVFFSDHIEKFIPPKKGRTHILHIIRELINFMPLSRKTNLNEPIKYLTNAIKKRATVFVISDFLCENFEDSLKIAARKHDIAALHVTDPRDLALPDIGLVRFADPESGELRWIDTSLKSTRKSYETFRENQLKKMKTSFSKCGVDYASMKTGEDYVKPLLGLFKARGK